MKVLDLQCSQGHSFEGWFGSQDDYDAQRARGLVSCPVCDSVKVEKAIMAPRIVGKKGREALKRDLADKFVGHVDLSEVRKIGYDNAQAIARDVLARFDAGEFDVATLFFNRFQSVISQIPTALQVIPAKVEVAAAPALYDYEPGEEEILADLLPRGVATQV